MNNSNSKQQQQHYSFTNHVQCAIPIYLIIIISEHFVQLNRFFFHIYFMVEVNHFERNVLLSYCFIILGIFFKFAAFQQMEEEEEEKKIAWKCTRNAFEQENNGRICKYSFFSNALSSLHYSIRKLCCCPILNSLPITTHIFIKSLSFAQSTLWIKVST